MKMESASGADLNQFADVVPVARLTLQQREDQHLGTALLPLVFNRRHICHSHMYYAQLWERFHELLPAGLVFFLCVTDFISGDYRQTLTGSTEFRTILCAKINPPPTPSHRRERCATRLLFPT